MNAASEESDDEEEEEVGRIGDLERKANRERKFSGVLLYSRFQSYCEKQKAILEPSKEQEEIHTGIIAELEEFSQSFQWFRRMKHGLYPPFV